MPDSRQKVANLAENCNIHMASSGKDQSSFDGEEKGNPRDDGYDDNEEDDDDRSCRSEDDDDSEGCEPKHNKCAVKSKSKGLGGKIVGTLKKLTSPDHKYQRLLAQIYTLESEKAVVESKLDQLQFQMANKAEEVVKAHKERDDLKAEVTRLQLQVETVGLELEKTKEAQNTSSALELRLCQGFLWKRGVRGLTGRNWRYRWFEAKKDGKIHYYRCSWGGWMKKRGFIDIRNIDTVVDLPALEQNEENSSFNVVTPKRTYEVKGRNEEDKSRWIKAIDDLTYWVKLNDQQERSEGVSRSTFYTL